MPQSSRQANKVETKYNVTTDFPDLGLHAAAISGNYGLAHYALTNGQPENSVLHGLLPLHAACSGGSEPVVRLLLDRGADVNAPRLPRRYSNETRKAPSVGVSGSGPLHFAAANGHFEIVKLLLSKGAIYNKLDKHGLTPEDLAYANGHDDIVSALRAWETLQNSMRERDDSDGTPAIAEEGSLFTHAAPRPKSRVGSVGSVKRGIENIVHRSSRRASSGTFTSDIHLPNSPSDLLSLRNLSKLSITSLSPSESALSTHSPTDPPSRRLATDPPPTPLPAHIIQPRQRRPSLPSIIEKAAFHVSHSKQHGYDPTPSIGRSRSKRSIVSDTDSRSASSSKKTTSHKSLLHLFSHRSSQVVPHVEDEFQSDGSQSSLPSNAPSRTDDDRSLFNTINAFTKKSFQPASPRGGSLDLPQAARIDEEDLAEGRHWISNPPPSAPAVRTTFFPSSPIIPQSASSSLSSTAPGINFRMDRTTSRRSSFSAPSPDPSDYESGLGERSWNQNTSGGAIKFSEAASRSPLGLGWSTTDLNRHSHVDNSFAGYRRSISGESAPRRGDAKGKGRASSYSDGDSQKYLSSSSANEGSYYHASPISSEPHFHFVKPTSPWLSLSSRNHEYDSDRGTPVRSVLERSFTANSGFSSDGSSLRRVASANLRRNSFHESSKTYSLSTTSLGDAASGFTAISSGPSHHTSRGVKSPRSSFYGPKRPKSLTLTDLRDGDSGVRGFESPLTLNHSPSLSKDTSASEDYAAPIILVSDTSTRTGRPRNISISSVSSVGSTKGGPTYSPSSSATNFTNPSFLSSGAPSTSSGGAPSIPSVPENPLTSPTDFLQQLYTSRSEASLAISREEAHQLVEQAERAILAVNRNSVDGATVSLSAQLAAYGEKLALERSLAQGELHETRDPKEASDRRDETVPTRSFKSTFISPSGSVTVDSPHGSENEDPIRSGRNDTDDTLKAERISSDTELEGSSSFVSTKLPSVFTPAISNTMPTALNSPASSLSSNFVSRAKMSQQTKDRRASNKSHKKQSASTPLTHVASTSLSPSSVPGLPNVSQIYVNRAEALRKKGIEITSAVSSPLAYPISPSIRKGTSSSNSKPFDDDNQVWIISGHKPSTFISTVPSKWGIPPGSKSNTRGQLPFSKPFNGSPTKDLKTHRKLSDSTTSNRPLSGTGSSVTAVSSIHPNQLSSNTPSVLKFASNQHRGSPRSSPLHSPIPSPRSTPRQSPRNSISLSIPSGSNRTSSELMSQEKDHKLDQLRSSNDEGNTVGNRNVGLHHDLENDNGMGLPDGSSRKKHGWGSRFFGINRKSS
ncbi:FOG: Ankyrin repeat [Phaffia rhodozyma]|uniref:FOG: Ankyrin repeat n=1 Tax=Phaffia rhodozyma TaxID=264483 RepID=A0A0F7SIW0_PHARH|nr:FOG: Ankyrin repeat [Phaffia rhodozyma]